ncbi:MAG TPA: ABC transporter permease, partial [Bryobacteraceae bacterium]
MDAIRQKLARIAAYFRPGAFDRDLDQELETHLDLLADEHMRRGLSRDAARRAARVELGGVAQLHEAHREARGLPAVDTLLQDVRYGVRMLRKTPWFTAFAAITLAVGIAVNAAVFTLYNAVALQPIQARDPGRLAQVTRTNRDPMFSYPDYVHYRDHSRALAPLAVMATRVFSMTGAGPAPSENDAGVVGAVGLRLPRPLASGAEPVNAVVVSGNYFQMLGAAAARGRTFLPEDDAVGAPAVALVSDNFRRRRFPDAEVLGRRLRLNGIDVTVIGVTARDFTGTYPLVPDLWIPVSLEFRLSDSLKDRYDRSRQNYRLYGRLAPVAERGQAQEEMNALWAGLRASLPEVRNSDEDARIGLVVGEATKGAQPGNPNIAAPVILLSAFGLVLLIACANVASLLLARSAARRREIAVRLAIGAGRRRLIRQLLTESMLMSLIAAAAGILLSWWAMRFLVTQAAAVPLGNLGTITLDVAPDLCVLGYVVVLSMAATIGFGLAPALEASRPDLSGGLKDEGATFGMRVRKSRLRELLVGGQIAVSLLLLIAATLLARSSERALTLDLGFD